MSRAQRGNYTIYRDGRLIFSKPITVQLKDSSPGIPITTLEGAYSVRGGDGTVHHSHFSDTDGDPLGKYDADDRATDNHYSETSGKFHRRPSYTPGGTQRARIVEEATTTAFYTEIGKNYAGTTFADWIVCKYLDTSFHWFRADYITGNFVFGAAAGDVATSRITLASGDVEITDPDCGVIMKSPNGTRWRVTVDDTGVLHTTEAT